MKFQNFRLFFYKRSREVFKINRANFKIRFLKDILCKRNFKKLFSKLFDFSRFTASVA